MPTTVSTFAQLKAAIEDQTTTEIVVTADIKILSGGAKVNVTKPSLVMDFGGFKVTDYNSLTFTDTNLYPHLLRG